MTGDESKVQCCKEHYCMGTWNVRSMNQTKLEEVKKEMARMNIDILGISKLKWTGMCKFNLDDDFIYDCGQESLRGNEVALIVNKRVWNAVLGCIGKIDKMTSVHFQGKPFNVTIIWVYAPPLMPKKLKLSSSRWHIRTSRMSTKKINKIKYPFHHRGLECKCRKSRDTWSNRQVWS